MSSPDRPHAPQPSERGAWPAQRSRPRDLAGSAADGWPSVAEWREQRIRTRAADSTAPATSDDASDDLTMSDDAVPLSGGGAADIGAEAQGEAADLGDGDAQGGVGRQAGRNADPAPVTKRPGDEWHSEVLAGSSWFAPPEQDDSGKRRSGGSGKRTGRSGAKSGRPGRESGRLAEAPERPTAEPRWPTDESHTSTSETWGPADAAGWLGNEPGHGDGAAGRRGDRSERFGEAVGRPGTDSSETGERGSTTGQRRGGRGRSGRGGRKKERGRGWLPDGPDGESPAGSGPKADPESVARAICLRLLTMAPKTRAQLAEALRKRDVPEEAAEAVLSRFSELGLINDEAFATAWVDSRHHGRGLAKRALAAELRHRGVDSDTVNEAVERLDPDQEEETARRLVERKLAATRSLDPQTRTRRLAGMLARKGYPSGLSFRVIREALEQEGIEVEEDYS
ncbi:recombination regulator RecX [Nonomuraea sp. MG754425]|uniref:recombination regulator RecX n=1 Tax=Nonomuraea sp. MG754425 TaxID=2570319 RepID=UPI0027E04E4A|nr:recombination regulator RecX [Nonomuraea sp. MG754425]